ncbi:replication protein, partial [Staphylococcus epidermidis]
RFDDWFPLLCDNSTFIMSNYIKSIRHRKKRF